MKRRLTLIAILVSFLAGSSLLGVYAQSPPIPTRLLTSGTGSKTDTTNLAILAAPGAGLRYYIVEAQCVNASATLTTMDVKNGTTIIWSIPCPASGLGTASYKWDPPLRQATANTAINVASSAAVTTAYFNVRAYVDR